MSTLPVPITSLIDLHVWLSTLHAAIFSVHHASAAKELGLVCDKLNKLRSPLLKQHKNSADLKADVYARLDKELLAASQKNRWTEPNLETKREFVKGCVDLFDALLMARPCGHPSIYSDAFMFKMSERWQKEEEWLNSLFEPIERLKYIIAELPQAPAINAQQSQATAATMKQPSAQAIAIYRACTIGGMTQTELAKRSVELLGEKVNQGTISRVVRKVKRYLEAGNVLPDLAPPKRKPSITSSDPQVMAEMIEDDSLEDHDLNHGSRHLASRQKAKKRHES